jgi:Bbp16
MILDAPLVLSSAQAITVTAPSSRIIDVSGQGSGNAPGVIYGTQASVFGEDIGTGGPAASAPQLAVFVSTTFTAGGAATLTIQLQAAIDNGSNAPSTWDTIAQSDAIPVADLTTGLPNEPIWSVTVPRRYPSQGLPRFYRVNYVVATGPMTAGALNAAIATGVDDPVFPPSGF